MENKEYRIIDLSKYLSFKQLREAVVTNVQTISLLQKEVQRLRILNSKVLEEKNENEIISDIDLLENEDLEKDTKLSHEIMYYLSNINEVDFNNSENLYEKILQSLPSPKNGNFHNIIYGINAEILKDINEIKKFIESEKDNFTKEELQEFKEDIIANQRKITTINQAVFTSINNQDQDFQKEKLNNIVFMETSSGNIYALEDLDEKRIPKEYYEGFYELLTSIQDGTFKNVKMLTSNNNKTRGIAVVRSHKRRIIFDRIGVNTYVILGIFTKKSDMDNSYIYPLEIRIDNYRNQREELIKRTKDKNYMLEQQEILNKIYEKIRLKQENKNYEKVVK